LFLTEPGQTLAPRAHARHRLVVDVLMAIGVPAEATEADAEGIEHQVSDPTLKAFTRFLAVRFPQATTGATKPLRPRQHDVGVRRGTWLHRGC
jgi:Mn-dependent DtxR family transcriptional regulator